MRDLHNNVKVSRGISPAAAITGNGTTTGEGVERTNFDSLEFAFQSGVITDGAFACKLFHDDDPAFGTEAEVTDATHLLGSAPSFAATDDNVVKRVGYRGPKKHVRPKVVQSGATSGGCISCVAIQAHPKIAPVS